MKIGYAIVLFCLVQGCKHRHEETGEIQGLYSPGTIWRNFPVSVCFVPAKDNIIPFEKYQSQNSDMTVEENQFFYSLLLSAEEKAIEVQKKLVKAAITRSWVANSPVTFSGWEDCTSQTAHRGISIAFVDRSRANIQFYRESDDSLVKGDSGGNSSVGLESRSRYPSMHLPLSSTDPYAMVSAVHEFGHALGLEHEHERPDSECHESGGPQSLGSRVKSGRYDEDSIMNYCGLGRSSKLSTGDVRTVQEMYGVPENSNPTETSGPIQKLSGTRLNLKDTVSVNLRQQPKSDARVVRVITGRDFLILGKKKVVEAGRGKTWWKVEVRSSEYDTDPDSGYIDAHYLE